MHYTSATWMARRDRPFVDRWRGQQFMMDGNRTIVPAVIDSLVVPADDHPLSSARGMAAVVISPAVQRRHAGGVAETEAAFRILSRVCADLGGRVHLTKHVFAEPDVLDQMYSEGMTRFRRARSIFDPSRLFGSPFLDRLDQATAVRAAA